MRNTLPALILILAVSFPFSAHAQSRLIFEKDNHRCSLDYDATIFTSKVWDAESFLRYSDQNSGAYFQINAVADEQNLTPEQLRKEYLLTRGTDDLTYHRYSDAFLVLSGYRGQEIFYTKLALSPDNKTICILHIYYPRQMKAAFDGRVTQMSRSFAASN